MKSFAAKFKEVKNAQDILENTTTWADVREEAEAAIDAWQRKSKSNPYRRGLRAVGDFASRLEFLTELLPKGDYGSIVCGGLKLVYCVSPIRPRPYPAPRLMTSKGSS